MPVMNGPRVDAALRDFERLHKLEPAFILDIPGLGSGGGWEKAFSSGLDLYLMKPTRIQELGHKSPLETVTLRTPLVS
ncbi:hsp90-like protein [Verticillium dahliae]